MSHIRTSTIEFKGLARECDGRHTLHCRPWLQQRRPGAPPPRGRDLKQSAIKLISKFKTLYLHICNSPQSALPTVATRPWRVHNEGERGRCPTRVFMSILDVAPQEFAREVGIVKKLSRRHHELAKLLGSGVAPGIAATMMHYDASRVSILLSDPSFKELVRQYSRIVDAEFVDAHKKMAYLQETVVEEIQTRLEENPAEYSSGALNDLLKITSDRSGLGPTSTVRNVNVTLSAAELNEIKQRALASQEGRVERISSQRQQAKLSDLPVLDGEATELRDEAEESNSKGGHSVPANSNEAADSGSEKL